jgi:hypothetical protein
MPANHASPRTSYGATPTIRQTCRDRQAVRAATRPAGYGEAVEPKVVGNRLDVSDAVVDRAPAMAIGCAIPRAVVGDESGTGRGDPLVVRVAVEAAARRAVDADDR